MRSLPSKLAPSLPTRIPVRRDTYPLAVVVDWWAWDEGEGEGEGEDFRFGKESLAHPFASFAATR
jgi:hypothetical protein